MTCHEVEELLEDFLNQNLDVRQRAAVENHLLSCSECSNKLADLSLSREWLAEMMEEELPLGLHERIMTSVKGAAQRQGDAVDNIVELPQKRKLSYPERAILYEQSTVVQKRQAPAWTRWAAMVAVAAVLLVGAQRVFNTDLIRPPNETASGSAEGALLSQSVPGLLRGIYSETNPEDGETTLRLDSADPAIATATGGGEGITQDETETGRVAEDADVLDGTDPGKEKMDASNTGTDLLNSGENADADDAMVTPESVGIEELSRRIEPRASLSLMVVPGSMEAPPPSSSGGGSDNSVLMDSASIEANEAEVMDETPENEHEEAEPMMLMNAALPQRMEADAADSEALAGKYYGVRVSEMKGSLDGWLLTLKPGAVDLQQIVQRAAEFNCSAVLSEDSRSVSLYGANRSLYQLLQLLRLTDDPQWAAPSEQRSWRVSIAQEAERWNHLLIVLAD